MLDIYEARGSISNKTLKNSIQWGRRCRGSRRIRRRGSSSLMSRRVISACCPRLLRSMRNQTKQREPGQPGTSTGSHAHVSSQALRCGSHVPERSGSAPVTSSCTRESRVRHLLAPHVPLYLSKHCVHSQCTVVSRYLRGMDPGLTEETKIRGCSRPYCEMT